ncbi:MAG: helicase, partial [Chloroflexus sp.]|nr:helicase [Chloroflexus sp.]
AQALLHEREAMAMVEHCRPVITIAATVGDRRRLAPTARLVITTLPELHSHLLRFHDRAWRFFWQQLQLIAVADLHVYYGMAAGHLMMILLRAARLTPHPLLLGGSLAQVEGAEVALQLLSGREWRLSAAEDLPRSPTTLALWQSSGERQRDLATLTEAFLNAGASVHLLTTPFEVGILRPMFAQKRVSVGVQPLPAHVHIVTGADVGAATLQAALNSGAALVILLLGRGMAEPALQRLAVTDLTTWPLLRPPVWPTVTINPFVVALHLVCAASEQPLREDEIRQWQLEPIVDRLTAQGSLCRLPDTPPVWLPTTQSDPYILLELHAAGMEPLRLLDAQGQQYGTVDPSLANRWAHPMAALPPLRGGVRVVSLDEDQGTLQLTGQDGRRTLPLRSCQVQILEEWAQRELRRTGAGRGLKLSWGRVLIEEQTYAYREQIGRNPAQERTLPEPLSQQWRSLAVWVHLTRPLQVIGQQIGWSCAAAIALTTLARLEDCVPAYDPETQRLYFIDSQPNGNGLAEWLYEQLETILPLAYDVALDQRSDPLCDVLARTDMDWLLAILGGETDAAVAIPVGSPTGVAQPETTVRVAEPPVPIPAPPAQTPTHPEPLSDQPPADKRPVEPQHAPYQRPLRPNSRQLSPERQGTPAPPEPPSSTPSAEPLPDPEAILARLRQRRGHAPSPAPGRPPRPLRESTGETRFQPGDRIICMPYGAGRVRESMMSEGREILLVEFDEHGELRIDPSINVVRRLASDNEEVSE